MAIKLEEFQQPNNTPLSQTRRSALKKMLVGTGVAAGAAAVPKKWTQPLMNKVLIPAHSQTSRPTSFSGSFAIEFEQFKLGKAGDKLDIWSRMAKVVLPEAHAVPTPDPTPSPTPTPTPPPPTPPPPTPPPPTPPPPTPPPTTPPPTTPPPTTPPPTSQKLTGEMCIELLEGGTKYNATLKVEATGGVAKGRFSTSGMAGFPPTAFFEISGAIIGSKKTFTRTGGCDFPVPLSLKVSTVGAVAEFEVSGNGLFAKGSLSAGSTCPSVDNCPF